MKTIKIIQLVDEVNYKRILPYFSVISDNINSSELDDITINNIKYDIINFLNYDQLDYLLESIHQQGKKEIIKKIILQQNYRWYNQIENEFKLNIKNARLSLNTSEYLAFIIGKKVELKKFKDSELYFDDWMQTNFLYSLKIKQNSIENINLDLFQSKNESFLLLLARIVELYRIHIHYTTLVESLKTVKKDKTRTDFETIIARLN